MAFNFKQAPYSNQYPLGALGQHVSSLFSHRCPLTGMAAHVAPSLVLGLHSLLFSFVPNLECVLVYYALFIWVRIFFSGSTTTYISRRLGLTLWAVLRFYVQVPGQGEPCHHRKPPKRQEGKHWPIPLCKHPLKKLLLISYLVFCITHTC